MTFVDQKPMQTRVEITWTDDRVELLKRLWQEGLSASQIAGELGGITRNAVIGKVHRLGLSGRAKAPSSAAPRQGRMPRRAMRGTPALARQPYPIYEIEPELEPQPLENIVPIGQRCSLLDLS